MFVIYVFYPLAGSVCASRCLPAAHLFLLKSKNKKPPHLSETLGEPINIGFYPFTSLGGASGQPITASEECEQRAVKMGQSQDPEFEPQPYSFTSGPAADRSLLCVSPSKVVHVPKYLIFFTLFFSKQHWSPSLPSLAGCCCSPELNSRFPLQPSHTIFFLTSQTEQRVTPQ